MPNDQFCMHCGVQLVAQVRRCPSAARIRTGRTGICIFCGETLSRCMTISMNRQKPGVVVSFSPVALCWLNKVDFPRSGGEPSSAVHTRKFWNCFRVK